MTRPNEEDLAIMAEHTQYLSCPSAEGMADDMGVSMATARKYLHAAGYVYDDGKFGYIDMGDEYREDVIGWTKAGA